MKIKDKILSETLEEVKQRVRDTANKLVMKNIHILQTDKPSRLACDFDKLILNSRLLSPILYKNQNIYITSDEEIKDGDWFYNTISLKPEPFKACENGDGYVNCSKYSHYRIDCKKIILTTDQDLIGVQSIDDEFLEWFVKNPSCEVVEVDKAEHGIYKDDVYYKLSNKIFYKIIIPKEEKTKCYCGHTTTCDCGPEELEILETPMPIYNQETLEEASKRFLELWVKNNTSTRRLFIEGAKWQQERSYSEEEVLDITKQAYSMGRSNYTIKAFNELFEQFKKK